MPPHPLVSLKLSPAIPLSSHTVPATLASPMFLDDAQHLSSSELLHLLVSLVGRNSLPQMLAWLTPSLRSGFGIAALNGCPPYCSSLPWCSPWHHHDLLYVFLFWLVCFSRSRVNSKSSGICVCFVPYWQVEDLQ